MESNAIELAVQNYLSQMTPDQLLRSNSYFVGTYWLGLVNILLSVAITALLMCTPLSINFRDRAHRLTRFNWLATWIYFAQYLIVTTLLTLPLSIYEDYFREHQYGLSNLTFSAWTVEQLKGLAVALVLGGIFVSIVYAVIKKFPNRWWFAAASVTILFFVFSAAIAPVFLAPIFNTYQPLEKSEVRTSILSMARANGIPASDVYWFDASKQSKRISANVSGLFGTTRISLNDNLLKRTSLSEIRAVMGHEMGHYVMHHSLKFIVLMGILFTLIFYLIFIGLNQIITRWGKQLRVNSVADIATMPLLFVLLSVLLYLAKPITNTIVRTQEIEADYFGLNLAREPDGFAKTALLLSEYRKMSPGYWEEVIFFDHPSGEARIRAAMTWKAENLK